MPIVKINFCPRLCGFRCYLDGEKAANYHVISRMVGEVEMSRDWFGSVFIVRCGWYRAGNMASSGRLMIWLTDIVKYM